MLTTAPDAALSPEDLNLGPLFEHVRDPMLVADVTTQRVVLWNAAAEQLFGYAAADVRNLPLVELVPTHLQARLRGRLEAYAAGRRARLVDSGAAVEMTARSRNGEALLLEVRLSAISQPDRGGRFVLAIARPVAGRGATAEERFRNLEALYRADERLYGSLRQEDVLQALVDIAADWLSADKTSVLIWDDRHERLSVQAAHGFRPETIPRMSFTPGEGISTRVAASGQTIAVEDVRADPRIPPHLVELNTAENIRSLISVPIMLGGEVFGVFNVHSSLPRVFTTSERQLLLILARRAALAIENARLFAQSERRRREMEALYFADAVLYRSLELQAVLEALVEVVTEILGADKAQVLVWDARHERLVVGAHRGYSAETVASLAFRPGEGIAGRVAATGQTLMVEDALADPRTDERINAITAKEGVRSYICVPIVVRGSVFGVFSVVYCEPRTFGEEDQRPLEALAQRAAVAVQNAELYARVQSAAALEERQRLARELHDAVTQTLFSASLIAEVLPRVWERDAQQGRARLEELRRLSRGALAEMRTLLLELRPLALTETPIADLLRQLAEASMSRSSIAIEVVVDGQPRELAGDVQVALYRLAQEALNNVMRHAQADHAEIRLDWVADGLRLRITDDGQGFDPASVSAGHLGIGFMHERASAVGASITIESRPGAGTSVSITWRGQ